MTIESELMQRCHSKCELCSSGSNLSAYEVPPITERSVERSVMLCESCQNQIDNPESMDTNHWHCLNESMWSEFPAVQVMAWRILKRLNDHSWAQDLLEQFYMEEQTQQWAEAGLHNSEAGEQKKPTLDSNGTPLLEGDTVTLIKDLDVKGANFTAKRGTVVRKISLTDNPEHIEGRVNGTQIVLLTCFLKKAK